MRENIESKKKVLLASENKKKLDKLTELIGRHLSSCQFYCAADGTDAISKLENDPPHILIVDKDLPKHDGIQITNWMLGNKKFNSTAVIILSDIPDKEHFIEFIVTGRIQFASVLDDTFSTHLARALNFVSHGDNAEFHIRFLAANDTLMKEGDKPDFVYIVKRGRLKAISSKTGQEVILGYVESGEFVGEMAYISGEPRSASIVALDDCELIEIPVERVDQLLFQKPAWSRALVKTLTKRVKSTNLKLANHS